MLERVCKGCLWAASEVHELSRVAMHNKAAACLSQQHMGKHTDIRYSDQRDKHFAMLVNIWLDLK